MTFYKKLAACIALNIFITGCATTTVSKDADLALLYVHPNKLIHTINGELIWPRKWDTTTSPGEKSLYTLPATGSFINNAKPDGPFVFTANKGRRYEILSRTMLLTSDATQKFTQPSGSDLRVTPVLYKNGAGAIVVSAVTKKGEDATKLPGQILPPLALIEAGGNSNDWTPARSQREEIQQATDIVRHGSMVGVGYHYLHVGSGPARIIMKQCEQCKTSAVYEFDVKAGERYELAPNGSIYVSNAFSENVEQTRRLLR